MSNPMGESHFPEPYCARCGSSADRVECERCGGDGVTGHDCGEDSCCCAAPEDNVTCDTCGGAGGWLRCLSDAAWCESHPAPGCEAELRGNFKWTKGGSS